MHAAVVGLHMNVRTTCQRVRLEVLLSVRGASEARCQEDCTGDASGTIRAHGGQPC